jgi:hypothetical protein
MIICAHDLAFCNLFQYAWPAVATPHEIGDVHLLFALVVKLQNDDVGLATIDARMCAQVVAQSLPCCNLGTTSAGGPRGVMAVLGGKVVGPVINAFARLAHTAATVYARSIYWKLAKRLYFLAGRTALLHA